jgi:hypothetical protein
MIYDDSATLVSKTLVSTAELSTVFKMSEMNNKLIALGLNPNEEDTVQFKLTSSISDDSKDDDLFSDLLTLYLKPFETATDPTGPFIYMLGGATSAGWTNDADHVITAIYLPASEGDSTFAAVDHLLPNGTGGSDGFIKFVRFVGAWAPQWGSDGAGTWESGILVYRPDDAAADPTPIPAPDLEDDYRVVVDIVNLTYTIAETVESLHVIGDASEAGWDNTKAVPMTKDAPGRYSVVTTLSADATEGFKFLEFQGKWAPMYGQDGNGAFESGNLQYRPTEDVTDPKSIPPPETTGSYLIEVDITAGTYKVTAH